MGGANKLPYRIGAYFSSWLIMLIMWGWLAWLTIQGSLYQ